MSVSIVTGASRGIGRAIAESLARAGHELLLADVRADIDNVAHELGADAVVDVRVPLGMASLALGGGVEADTFWQSLARTDAARVAAAGTRASRRYSQARFRIV